MRGGEEGKRRGRGENVRRGDSHYHTGEVRSNAVIMKFKK